MLQNNNVLAYYYILLVLKTKKDFCLDKKVPAPIAPDREILPVRNYRILPYRILKKNNESLLTRKQISARDERRERLLKEREWWHLFLLVLFCEGCSVVSEEKKKDLLLSGSGSTPGWKATEKKKLRERDCHYDSGFRRFMSCAMKTMKTLRYYYNYNYYYYYAVRTTYSKKKKRVTEQA